MLITFCKNVVSWLPTILLLFFIETSHKGYTLGTYFLYSVIPLAILVITSSFLNLKARRLIYTISNLLFITFVYIDISHYLLYKTKISPSTFFIIFETNLNEASEYLRMYMDLKQLLIFVLLLTSFLISSYYYKFNKLLSILLNYFSNNKAIKNVSMAAFLIIVIIFRNELIPYTAIRSYLNYKSQLTELQKTYSNKKGGDFKEIKQTSENPQETIVLVIGESTNRNHMSLYGYKRNTNPLLSKIKDELIIYNDVISPHTHTIASLKKLLTLGNSKNPGAIIKGSVLQLFNRANYRTSWLSNQRPLGNYETETTALATSSDNLVFANTQDNDFDEVVLYPLTKALTHQSKKNFIIIHLMGTHILYSKRYPERFNNFTTNPETKFKNTLAYKTINEYDNAILYNDSIVYSIIKMVKRNQPNSCVIYLSDHGEDVYETTNNAFHEENSATKPMYDIPFILWMSKKFKESRKTKIFKTDRSFNTESLIHSLSDLANIKFSAFKPENSLFNKKFEQKNRYILENKVYEEYFKINN